MSLPLDKLPQHVAFIMDGNGRWAQARGENRLKGHGEGVETLRRVIEELIEVGVPNATFYAFSTENWGRPSLEVKGLFNLMRLYFRKELASIIKKGMRVRFIGDRSDARLDADIRSLMEEVEAKTAHNTKITTVFAINYGGRDEILRTAQKLAEQGKAPTAENFAAALDTAGLPDPDLIIRTSGEQRISGFLLWQAAYAELYFSEVAWPDFGPTHLHAALSSFVLRERRFGGLTAAAKVA
ncbi:MAG TPA: polyprenyl diphosphate synthase [Alphaproteobacteria bacterium]|nr:polyprenyl diphosphate synthase [Alphaproteobacteria bacterium]